MAAVPETTMRGVTGHEQEERLEIKKKQKRITAKPVSKSTGKVTTIPFGDDDEDHNAINGVQLTKNASFRLSVSSYNGLLVR